MSASVWPGRVQQPPPPITDGFYRSYDRCRLYVPLNSIIGIRSPGSSIFVKRHEATHIRTAPARKRPKCHLISEPRPPGSDRNSETHPLPSAPENRPPHPRATEKPPPWMASQCVIALDYAGCNPQRDADPRVSALLKSSGTPANLSVPVRYCVFKPSVASRPPWRT